MVIILFFLAAFLIAVALKFIFTPSNSAKKVVMSSNPIDGIRFGGVMGFELGDSYEFCLSRFKHLDINVDYQDNTGTDSMILGWGKNQYNNINEVRFIFESKTLVSIVIDVDFSKDGIQDMYGILISRICRVLKTEPVMSDAKQTAWASPKYGIILFRHPVLMTGGENLLIQIGSL